MRLSSLTIPLCVLSLMSCSEILRQPDAPFDRTEQVGDQQEYIVKSFALNAAQVRQLNSEPFQRMALVGGRNGTPVRQVLETEAVNLRMPPQGGRPEYRLGVGDTLTLTRVITEIDASGIERDRAISTSLRIAADGGVELADGTNVNLEGKTLNEARDALTRALIAASDALAEEVVEKSFPVIPHPPYQIGAGDVITLGRKVPTLSESGEVVDELKFQPLAVSQNGTVTLIDVGEVDVAGLTVDQVRRRIEQELLRSGITAAVTIEVNKFASQSVLVTGEIATRIVPLTVLPMTVDRLVSEAGLSFANAKDYLVILERDGERYRMRARSVLFEEPRDKYILLDGDRITVERLSNLPAFQLDVAEFNSQFVSFLTTNGGNRARLLLTDRGLDLRSLLIQNGISVTRSTDQVVRLVRGGREYRLSARGLLLDHPNQKIWLEPEDDIIVEPLRYSRDAAIVFGEVSSPQRITIDPVQRTTLAQLLDSAKLFSDQDADYKRIYLLRGKQEQFRAYELDLQNATRIALSDQLEMRPGDIVFVSTRPISQFNRILSATLGLRAVTSDILANSSSGS